MANPCFVIAEFRLLAGSRVGVSRFNSYSRNIGNFSPGPKNEPIFSWKLFIVLKQLRKILLQHRQWLTHQTPTPAANLRRSLQSVCSVDSFILAQPCVLMRKGNRNGGSGLRNSRTNNTSPYSPKEELFAIAGIEVSTSSVSSDQNDRPQGPKDAITTNSTKQGEVMRKSHSSLDWFQENRIIPEQHQATNKIAIKFP